MALLEFRLAGHTLRAGAQVIELWYAGAFVGQITALPDTPTLRILSKYGLITESGGTVNLPGDVPLVQVTIKVSP